MANPKPGWERVFLGDVVDVVTEYWDRDSTVPERFVAGEHIDEGGLRVCRWGMTNDDLVPPTFNRRFRAGDVLLHSRNLNKLARLDFDGITGEKLFVLRSRNASKLAPALLPFLLQTREFSEYANRMSAGSTNKFLNKSPLLKYAFALPSLKEQEQIVHILDAQRAVIDAYQTGAEACWKVVRADLLESLVECTVGERVLLADYVDIKHGYAFPGHGFVEGMSEDPILLTPKNFTESGTLNLSSQRTKRFKGEVPGDYWLQPGDLVVLMTDLTPSARLLGAPGCIPAAVTVLHNQRIGLVRITRSADLLVDYLYYCFRGEHLRRQIRSSATGTTVRHTSPTAIRNCQIALPSLSQQRHLVERWRASDAAHSGLIARRHIANRLLTHTLAELLEAGDGVH